MASLIHDRWQTVWKELPVVIEGIDPEGVHDMRVASRRLRAAMDVSVDAFPAGWYRTLHKKAKEITSELGLVRDCDVQIEYFETIRDTSEPGERPGIDLLIERLKRDREAARTEMLAFLDRLDREGVREEVDKRFGSFHQTTNAENET